MVKDNKKPAPVLQHQGGQENEMMSVNNIPFGNHSTTPAHWGQEPVLDFLSFGSENARTAKEIAAALGCTTREVTRAVQSARRRGAPICSNPGCPRGYYLAAEKVELERCVRQLCHREREIAVTAAALENALYERDTLAGQMEITEGD